MIPTTFQWVATGGLLFLFIAVERLSQMAITNLDLTPEQRQRTRNTCRYALLFFVLVALMVVWADELKSGAIIASAFAVAIVLSCKEILMCAGGWWLKTTANGYRIGDRVIIGDITGDVLDYGVLSTTLMRIDQTTGGDYLRSGTVVTLPNSVLLTQPLHNITHSLKYSWRAFDFLVDAKDWKTAEREILECANSEVDAYRSDMEQQLRQMEANTAFHMIPPEPEVLVANHEDGRVKLTLRVGLPVHGLHRARDRIARKYLELQSEKK